MINNNETKLAWKTFDEMIGAGKVNVVDFNFMLKACYHFEQMQELVDKTMGRVGIRPDIVTFNTYVNRLMLEGNVAEAQRVVDVVMKRMGVEPNKRTDRTLKLQATDLSKMRTALLKQWLKQGGDDANAAAWNLFHKLGERNVADKFHYSIMLKACYDSEQMKKLMDNRTKKAGVEPNAVTYNAYVLQLKKEGNVAEADRVVNEDMKRLEHQTVVN